MKTKIQLDTVIIQLEDAVRKLNALRKDLPSEAPAVQESFSFITKERIEPEHTYKPPVLREPDPGKLPWDD